MRASIEKSEKNQVVLTVEVQEAQVTEALDQAFKKVVKKVNVPGFRKGKVPRTIFERKYGVESLYNDALDLLLPKAYTQAVEETNIDPVDRPDIEVEQFGKDQTLIFKAKVTVKPEVTLGEYKGLVVPLEEAQVTDEDLENELKRLQERHVQLEVIDDGTAEKDDTVIIDFEGFIDGKAFSGGKGERHPLEIGSNSFIPGFEEQLIGLGTGDFKEVEVNFPEVYHAEELAGKPAVFKVKIHEIKRKKFPTIDDEFAKDISESETLEEYKAELKTELSEKKKVEAEQMREAKIVETAAQNATVEIPNVMIEKEVDYMLRDFENKLQNQGMNLEIFLSISGQEKNDLIAQMRPEANKRVLHSIVLEEISKAENIEVSEEEIQKEIEEMAVQYKRTPEEIVRILKSNGSYSSISEDLKLRKTITFLVENSKTE